jgi:crotonobetaine/carnitine-CoA ligase
MYDKLRDHCHWVLPEVLAYQARTRGAETFVELLDGESLTYAQAEADAVRVAGYFTSLGVVPGDTVVVMLPNGLDYVRVWLGLGRLGAVFVALNTGLKGPFLEHQLRNAGAKFGVFHQTHLAALAEVAKGAPDLATVAIAGTDRNAPDVVGLRTLPFDGWRAAGAYSGPPPSSRDIACVMYTSGTTGPSKGVLMPHAHCYLFGLGAIDGLKLTERDRYYITLPLFHANGLFMQLYATLIAGASAVVRGRFSASEWLADIRRTKATVTNTLGAMNAFIFAQPQSVEDRNHNLRIVHAAPNTAEAYRIWLERYGLVDAISGFGMTEINIPVYGPIGRVRPGTSGFVYDRYFEVEIRDPETDDGVAHGIVGEIMVRPRVPFAFMAGYLNMPDKTVEAWRNFWFHTGDAGVMDSDGYISFVDRIKDCIRRRGENISSFEVENAIARMPGVKEVAAFAVPSSIPGGEDEVMLVIVPDAGHSLKAESVAEFASNALPRFAEPRFIEITTELPRTPTERVQKALLRKRGITVTTWDRERGRTAAV